MEVLEVKSTVREGRQSAVRNKGSRLYHSDVEDDGFVVTPELLEDIKISMEQSKHGLSIICKTKEESRRFLESL